MGIFDSIVELGYRLLSDRRRDRRTSVFLSHNPVTGEGIVFGLDGARLDSCRGSLADITALAERNGYRVVPS